HNDEAAQRYQDRRARADPIVDPSKREGAQPSRDIQYDAEHGHFGERHAESSGSKNAAERKEGDQSIRIEHVREEKKNCVRLCGNVSQRPSKLRSTRLYHFYRA